MIFENIKSGLLENQFDIVSIDQIRPWGGFFVISEDQAQKFADTFFENMDVFSLKMSGKLSPKILIVAPGKRLSWQYHYRRAEIWRVISGKVGIKKVLMTKRGH
jgi:mannose-6-phosphate isomerase-like protein (cupin superfamily)